MGRRKPWELLYDPGVRRHLATIPRKHYSLIQRQIESQLQYQPGTETRNRKPLLRPSMLDVVWELRIGPQNRFRVFYRFDRALHRVHILAIGVRVEDRLFVGGEEFEL